MDKNKFRLIHREHIDNYHKSLSEKVDRRKEIDQLFSLFEYEINKEENRLENYKKELDLNCVGENMMYLEQKEIVDELKSAYEDFNAKQRIEPIKLNYGKFNKQVIELLYKHLYPEFIEVEKNIFENKFLKDNSDIIRWKGTETSFVYLFNKIEIENFDKWKCLSKHFFNKKEKPFKSTQLSNVYTKLSYTKNVSSKEKMKNILTDIKKCISI